MNNQSVSIIQKGNSLKNGCFFYVMVRKDHITRLIFDSILVFLSTIIIDVQKFKPQTLKKKRKNIRI